MHELIYEFIWISSGAQAKSLASNLLHEILVEHVGLSECSGRFIRRLHIETPTHQRCDPTDIRTILAYAPHLTTYSDHISVRCNATVLAIGNAHALRVGIGPEEMFSALAHPGNKLRHLSWTNYDYNNPFHMHMSPMLQNHTSVHLEYLELTLPQYCDPNSSLHDLHNYPPPSNVSLPALRSLKATLDNVTFEILSQWHMPSLLNLSVTSTDFKYAGAGFTSFFAAHGPKLHQLELGHSSSAIEEHTLPTAMQRSLPLAKWCPNLREFVCSADAEWDWQNPDWIAPHTLLPRHRSLSFIGIRDIDRRLKDYGGDGGEFPFSLYEQLAGLMGGDTFPGLKVIRDMSRESDEIRRGVDGGVSEDRARLFWAKLGRVCAESGVILEDYRGVAVVDHD